MSGYNWGKKRSVNAIRDEKRGLIDGDELIRRYGKYFKGLRIPDLKCLPSVYHHTGRKFSLTAYYDIVECFTYLKNRQILRAVINARLTSTQQKGKISTVRKLCKDRTRYLVKDIDFNDLKKIKIAKANPKFKGEKYLYSLGFNYYIDEKEAVYYCGSETVYVMEYIGRVSCNCLIVKPIIINGSRKYNGLLKRTSEALNVLCKQLITERMYIRKAER